MKPIKVTHKFLGAAYITEACLAMQSMNPDTTSTYIEHDGEVKEVTKSLVA